MGAKENQPQISQIAQIQKERLCALSFVLCTLSFVLCSLFLVLLQVEFSNSKN